MSSYQPLYLPASEWFHLNGLNLHVLHWKNPGKPKLLLLHGWMDAAQSFQFLVDALPRDWDIFALDWRGMGFSEASSYGYYDRAMMLSDLKELIHVISPEEPIAVFGHSLGGMLLSIFAGVCPKKVRAVILAEAFGMADDNEEEEVLRLKKFLRQVEKLDRKEALRDPEHYIAKLRRDNPRLSAEKAHYLASFLLKKQDGETMLRADLRHRVTQPFAFNSDRYRIFWQRIRAPLLWIEGESMPHNRYLHGVAETLDERYAFFDPQPERVVIAGSGHMLHWEAPEELAARMAAFLTEVKGGRVK